MKNFRHFAVAARLIAVIAVSAPLSNWSQASTPYNCAAAVTTPGHIEIGMLVRLQDGREILVSDHYLLSKHQRILNWITQTYGAPEKILWSGELERSMDPRTPQKVLRANETSGLAAQLIKRNDPRAPGVKPVETLQDFLSIFPDSTADKPHFIAFDEKNSRLDLEAAARNVLDVRHDLGNSATRITMPLYFIDEWLPLIQPGQKFVDFAPTNEDLSVFLEASEHFVSTLDYLETRTGYKIGYAEFHLALISLLQAKSDYESKAKRVGELVMKTLDRVSAAVATHEHTTPPRVLYIF
ncbi:MAG: hypothetical protein EOP09_06360 [Proteobacteria bacterium]|nr:MAG: hypothetical protein EOP09_06360 [Pseudomonadota bacterium]